MKVEEWMNSITITSVIYFISSANGSSTERYPNCEIDVTE